MKAVQLTEYGDEKALQVVEADKPTIGEHQVLVEVRAFSVNPFDWKIRTGAYKEFIPVDFPAILGSDVAGIVSEVGSAASGFEVGQAVYGMANAVGGHGSYAEFTPVKAQQLSPKPASVDFVTAAALPLAALSAYQAIDEHIDLQAGQKILIHGGAGGIGALAIQMAKDRGAYVATTVSGKDVDYVKSLGADEVIDYKNQDFSELLSDYDAVFDTVGGETNTKSFKVLKSGATLVSMVQPGETELVKQHNIQYIQESTQPTQERLAAIAEMVDAGKLTVNIDKVYELEEAPAALEYLKSGHPRGKVVVKVSD